MSLFQKSAGDTPEASAASARTLILQFDGGSRGNPGPAGIGVTITTDTGQRLYELGEFLGHCTSNVAEYNALLRGLAAAIKLRASKLLIRADSELVVRQLNGIYKVKSPDLKPLYERAQNLIRQLPDVKVSHVYRESNSRADALANEAMDKLKRIEPLGTIEAIAAGGAVAGSPVGNSAARPAHGGTGATASKPAPRSPRDIKLIEVDEAKLPVVIHLSRLYAYDISGESQRPTPADGLFAAHAEDFWHNPHLTCFLIKVNNELAGYAALSSDPDAGTYALEDFFILRKFRRQKVGTFMLRTLFNRHPGPWSIAQPANPAAFAFLEKVLAPYAPKLSSTVGDGANPAAAGGIYGFNTE